MYVSDITKNAIHPSGMFQGSNMIVCVLLVSNSRGWYLAAPDDHEGAAMFDPDYNMMPPFFSTATNILLIKSNLSLNRAQPQSRLPCHAILVSSIEFSIT